MAVILSGESTSKILKEHGETGYRQTGPTWQKHFRTELAMEKSVAFFVDFFLVFSIQYRVVWMVLRKTQQNSILSDQTKSYPCVSQKLCRFGCLWPLCDLLRIKVRFQLNSDLKVWRWKESCRLTSSDNELSESSMLETKLGQFFDSSGHSSRPSPVPQLSLEPTPLPNNLNNPQPPLNLTKNCPEITPKKVFDWLPLIGFNLMVFWGTQEHDTTRVLYQTRPFLFSIMILFPSSIYIHHNFLAPW